MGLFKKLLGTSKPVPNCEIHPDDQDLVQAEDMHWWSNWSMDDWKSWENSENTIRMGIYIHEKDAGHSKEEASIIVHRNLPRYYYRLDDRSHDNFNISGEDAALPFVLKNRVDVAMANRVIIKSAVKQATSFNGYVRQLIREHRL